MSNRKTPLSYSRYINDRAIVEALRLPPRPLGVRPEQWPKLPSGWKVGDPWPTGKNWSRHEVLFIRTHQGFEVWFALVIHELDFVLGSVRDLIRADGHQPLHQLDMERDRSRIAQGVPLTRFPLLQKAIEELKEEDLKSRLKNIDTPGRYTVRGFQPRTKQLDTWAAALDRAARALEVCIPFFDVLKTLTSRDFMEFRGRLAPASGFGSTQFREIELMLGLREVHKQRLKPTGGDRKTDPAGRIVPEGMLRPTKETPINEANLAFYVHHEPQDWKRLVRRYEANSLRDLVYAILTPGLFYDNQEQRNSWIDGFAAETVTSTLRRYDHPNADLNAMDAHVADIGYVLAHTENLVAAQLYSIQPSEEHVGIRRFLDACMRLDAVMLKWRDTHIRFVEGIIGRQPGTGGGGLNYLRSTTDLAQADYRNYAFPCLWQARSLVRKTLA